MTVMIENKMKTAVFHNYGTPDEVTFEHRDIPTPKDDEILVKMVATSANVADLVRMTALPFLIRLMGEGVLKPKYPAIGMDVAGWVEAVGQDVTELRPGDAVFGSASSRQWGSFAEYTLATEATLAHKPSNISFEEAAAAPNVGYTAVQGLRQAGKLEAGQEVLVYGASGGVGTTLVQLAKAFGAEVTAVCSTRHLETMHALGADHIVDYMREDFAQSGKQYDIILAANGYNPLAAYKRALKPNGIGVVTGGTMRQVFQSMLLGPLLSEKNGRKLLNMGVARVDKDDLLLLQELLAAEKLRPVLDRCYPFSQAGEAFHYLNEGHAQGKVVVVIEEGRRQ